MATSEHARENAGNKRWLGRAGATCVLLFVAAYVIELSFSEENKAPPSASLYLLFALSGAGTVFSLAAVLRRSARTPLSWISFLLCIIWWFFYALSWIAGI